MIETITNIFTFSIFGNEVYRLLLFIIIIALSPYIAKAINYIINNYIRKLVHKTEFKFDDIIFNSLNPSITMFTFAAMFYLASLQINQGSFAELFEKLFNFLLIIPLVYFMIKFSTEMISFYLKGDAKKVKVNEAAIDILMQVVRIILVLIGILLILGNLGYDISALIAGLGVGGLAFALAAQDILKNFFAGIALIFDKTFNKGERVNFQGESGRIEGSP